MREVILRDRFGMTAYDGGKAASDSLMRGGGQVIIGIFLVNAPGLDGGCVHGVDFSGHTDDALGAGGRC